MTLQIHTARLHVRDPDAFNITRKSGQGDGLIFAPSWQILTPILHAREHTAHLPPHRQPLYAEEQYQLYRRLYLDEMRRAYRQNKTPFTRLLQRPRVVLQCYCVDPQSCHRTILAKEVLVPLGATFVAEIVQTCQDQQRGLF